MKVLMVNNKIVSLEKVKSVELREIETGSRSKPFSYLIDIKYINGDNEPLRFQQNKAQATEVFNSIFKRLEQD